MRVLSSGSHQGVARGAQDRIVRLPLIIATTVLLLVGVMAGAVALGSAADADPPAVEPITVEAPALPPADPGAGQPPPQPAPRDDDGYVAPPPPMDDDDDDDLGDDTSGDDDGVDDD
jgi:hypothetical protein